LPCPTCAGASLREFARRYICDECGGLLLGFEDFDQAVGELAGEYPNPRYFYGAKTTHSCPLCARAFVECNIVLELEDNKRVVLPATFLRCERDGLWCAGGVLEAVFAKASRASGTGRVPDVASDARVGPDGLPERRFVPSLRRRRPRTDTPVIDPHAGRPMTCPSCTDQQLAFQQDRWTCEACKGAFVAGDTLVAMVMEMTQRYWELPPLGATPGVRRCPVCEAALVAEPMEGVPVDRCGAHGVWFDAGELATTLERSAEDKRSWFARLFGPI
jgi:Zn-finger nucleic acid-binding protein